MSAATSASPLDSIFSGGLFEWIADQFRSPHAKAMRYYERADHMLFAPEPSYSNPIQKFFSTPFVPQKELTILRIYSIGPRPQTSFLQGIWEEIFPPDITHITSFAELHREVSPKPPDTQHTPDTLERISETLGKSIEFVQKSLYPFSNNTHLSQFERQSGNIACVGSLFQGGHFLLAGHFQLAGLSLTIFGVICHLGQRLNEHEGMAKKIEQLGTCIQKLEGVNNALTSNARILTRENGALTNNVQALTSEVRILTRENGVLTNNVQALTNEVSSLKEMHKAMSETLAQFGQNFTSSLGDLQGKTKSFDDTAKELCHKVVANQDNLQVQIEAITLLSTNFLQLFKDLSSLCKDSQLLINAVNGLNAIEVQLRAKQNQFEKLNQEHASLEGQQAATTEALKKLKEEFSCVLTQFQTTSKELEQVKDALARETSKFPMHGNNEQT